METPVPGSTDWQFHSGPISIEFNVGGTWAIRITKDGVASNPEVSVDDGAKAILAALERQIRALK